MFIKFELKNSCRKREHTLGGEALNKIRILLVDDHPLFVQGMKSFLDSNGFDVVATAKNGTEALLKYETTEPDLVLMDWQMEKFNGLETMNLIRTDYNDAKIIFLSAFEDDTSVLNALGAGANGFLLKGMEPEEFLDEINNFINGKMAIAKSLKFVIRDNLKDLNYVKNNKVLTNRQIQILRYVVQGQPYKDIAKALELKEVTVKYHINEIISKFHLSNRSELIAYVIKNNII